MKASTTKASSTSKTGPKQSFEDKFDDATLSAIRRRIHQIYYQNEIPTEQNVLIAVNNDAELPDISMKTLRLLLRRLNFKYLFKKRKDALLEKPRITLWRCDYIDSMKKYRSQDKMIYYLGETYWDELIDSKVALSSTTSLNMLQRKVFVNIGSEEGFVVTGDLLYETKYNATEKHCEDNTLLFETWFSNIVPYLKSDSVIVMDDAPHHRRWLEEPPTVFWKKDKIKKWLDSKQIPYDDTMFTAELIKIVKRHKKNHLKYAIDEIASANGITVLRIPPYHDEINPIELLWSRVKDSVYPTFMGTELKLLLCDNLENFGEVWLDCINKVITEEERLGAFDYIVDNVSDEFINYVRSNGYDDDEDDDDSESDSE